MPQLELNLQHRHEPQRGIKRAAFPLVEQCLTEPHWSGQETLSEEGLASATAFYVYSSLLSTPQVAEAESPNVICKTIILCTFLYVYCT